MNNLLRRIDIVNAVIALGVWLTALIIYFLTTAPTLSFWDCGEFIAASYILGVPHPPGTPLYILMGRLFSIIPLSPEIAVRVNVLSGVTSSLAALFGYLAAVRMLRSCFKDARSIFTRITIYAGGVSGTFFLAFGLTNWNNSVEAEVYGMAMMMMMAIFWLSLIYMEKQGTVLGERIMLLIVFIAFAGIGVHMTILLVVPVVAMLFILMKKAPSKMWFGFAIFIIVELYAVFALSSRPNEIPYYIPVVIVLILYLFYIFSFEKIPRLYQYVGGGLLLALLPLFGIGIIAFNRITGSNATFTAMDILSAAGKICFAALILFGLYLIYRYSSAKELKRANEHCLMPALFILSAAVMTLILFTIKGYFAFLIVTAFFSVILIVALWKYINWPILIALLSVGLVIIGVRQFFYGMAFGIVIILILGTIFKQPGWKNALLIIFVALLGYSVHIFIPIRSARQPMINENNPSENVTALINYIERKQYGSQSMIERMFKRRGEWVHQFGDYRRMGFWRFFNEQYGLTGGKFIILFIFGLFGVWEVIRKKATVGVPFLVFLLITSIGLVLYMNFADGTRQHPVTGADYIEVRNRDYFFTPAFMLFGLAIGMGITFVIQFVRASVKNFTPAVKNTIIAAALVLFLMPSYTLAKNYYLSDRSKNFMPFDYARNILISADENAVLITSGDNDTFPLWCLQEADSIRNDVKVVNLSLSNTTWYIKQIKSTMGIKLSWSDDQIDRLRPYRDRSGNVFRLQHQVVTEIIKENFGKRPINFCVTTPPGSRQFQGKSVDSLLSLNGMVWRMNQTAGGLRKDIESSIDLFTNPDRFKYRGVADQSVYKDETTFRLTRNYARGFMLVADSLKKAGDLQRAEWLMKEAIKYIPHSTDAINYLAAFYGRHNMRDELRELIDNTEYGQRRWLKTLLGRLERRQGDDDQAEVIYKEIMAENPSYKPPFDDLMRLYYDKNQLSKIKQVIRTWLETNPDDPEMKTLLRSIERDIKEPDTTAGDSS